jgi:hypothetical protein
MNVGEILDSTFTLFKEQIKSYLAIAALSMVAYVGLGLLILIVYYLLGETAAIIGGLVAFILAVIVSLAMTGGIIKKASEQILDREISCMEAYRFGFRKAWPLFLGGLLYFVILIAGTIFLVIPGIYFSILFLLFTQTIMIEDKGPWAALQRSRELIKGSWWRCFGILFLINILVSILTRILALPFTLLVAVFGVKFIDMIDMMDMINTMDMINAIFTLPVSFLLMPFSMIAGTLLYYDLRIRKDSLDVQLMVDNLTEKSSGIPSGE